MRWKRGRIRRVTLHGKPGCHLCEEARELLERLSRRYPMEIIDVDITEDTETFRAYDIRIPVITIDGKQVLEAPIDEAAVRAVLTRSDP